MAAEAKLEDEEEYDKAAYKLTAALRKPLAEAVIHLSTKILRSLNPHCTDAYYTFQWIHQVNPLSDIPALHDEIRQQLENLFGPNWNEDSRVGRWMMVIVYKGIEYLIREGKAWEAYLVSRLKTRTSRADDDDDDDDVCSICLDLLCQRDENIINVAVLDCRHEYHVQCIKKWLMHSNKNLCPLCKARALEIDPLEFYEIVDSNEIDEWSDGDIESLLHLSRQAFENSIYSHWLLTNGLNSNSQVSRDVP